MTLLVVLIALWGLAGVAGAAFPDIFVPPLVGFLTVFPWLLTGLILMTCSAVVAVRRFRNVRGLLVTSLVPVILGLLDVSGSDIERLGRRSWFVLSEAEMETAAARIAAGNPAGYRNGDGREPEVDRSLGLKIAFPYGSGLVDNWSAFVLDPQGDIQEAVAGGWGSPAFRRIENLFGGDVVGCEHVKGSWYFCSFT